MKKATGIVQPFINSLPKGAFTDEEIERIREAIEMSLVLHSGQTRIKDAEPYIMHPLRAAKIMIELGVRHIPAIQAQILHDTVENVDCEVTQKEYTDIIQKTFGDEVCMTVLFQTKALDKEIAKHYLTLLRDRCDKWASVLGKICDRIDNNETMPDPSCSHEKWTRKMRENREYFDNPTKRNLFDVLEELISYEVKAGRLPHYYLYIPEKARRRFRNQMRWLESVIKLRRDKNNKNLRETAD